MSKIDEVLKQIDAKRAEVEGWRTTADAIEAIAAEITAPPLRVQIGYEFSSLKGVLLMTDIADFKEIVPVFRRLRSAGYRVKSHEDTGEMNCRTYTMEYVEEGESAPFIVRAFLPWTDEGKASASCKFIQTGTKEVPVYELKCDANGDEVTA